MSISFLTTVHESNNLSGTARLLGLSMSNRYTRIRASDLVSYGLYKRISSARLYASSYVDGTVIFFGEPYIGLPLPDFTGRFIQMTNRKGATSALDISRFSDHSFNDRTQSVLLVGANRDGFEVRLSFRDLFLTKWNTFLDTSLAGSQAKRRGNPILTWEMWPLGISYLNSNLTYLKIHQELDIVLDWWPDYKASITYHIYLYLNGSGKLNGYVQRWAYWVESGVKASEIGSRLRPKVIQGMSDLDAQLRRELSSWSSFTFKKLYYLPERQTTRPGTGLMAGYTTEDVTLVLVL
jgi:hypothetical protein